MNNAYTEGADLIMISESGFVEGAQPYIDGYTQCGNVPKPIENLNSSYYTGGVAAWLSKESKFKVLYKSICSIYVSISLLLSPAYEIE